MLWDRKMEVIKICVLFISVLHCHGLSILDQLAHIAHRKAEERNASPKITRRANFPPESVILGAPLYPYHLPKSDPILPGHTLIRPAIGMLKSAVKFPHREQESGAGVYGNMENLGIKYDGTNERVMYSGFRRSLPGRLQQLQKKNKMRLLLHLPGRKPVSKKKVGNNRNYVKKSLTIYPDIPIKALKRDPMYGQKVMKTKALRFYDKTFHKSEPNYNSYYLMVIGGTDSTNFLNAIKPLREDQEYHKEAVKLSQTNVPRNMKLRNFVPQQNPDEEEIRKTVTFWDNKAGSQESEDR